MISAHLARSPRISPDLALPRRSLPHHPALHLTKQVAASLGGGAADAALPRDALVRMLAARQAEVEGRLLACAADAEGGEDEGAGWADMRQSIRVLLEAEAAAIDAARTAMLDQEDE